MLDIKISYFYQIRNFRQDMIPISTAVWDPKWYHQNKNQEYQFKDKRGVWNGIRAEIFNPSHIHGLDNFIINYKNYLNTLDFNDIMRRFEKLNNQLKQAENTDKDFTLVLIVYETPLNKFSERGPLIEWFAENGYNLLELEYPIQS